LLSGCSICDATFDKVPNSENVVISIAVGRTYRGIKQKNSEKFLAVFEIGAYSSAGEIMARVPKVASETIWRGTRCTLEIKQIFF